MMTKPKNQHLSISPTRRRGRLRTMQLNPVPSCMISLQLCSIVTFLLIIILISYNTYNANVLFLSDINASPKDSIIEKTKQQFLYEADNNGSTPHVAWLMSFPNSGTSYTMHLVRSLSNTTCATNYEKEANVKDTIPISGLSPHGPFLLKNDMIVPKRFILTKTHCAGYCNECPIGKYIINRFEFQQGCATNILTSTHIDAMNRNIHNAIYDYRIEPKRVIRLVRDPFDNVVSNFHHWLGKQATLGNGLDKDYTRDRKGFMDYCKGYNALFENKMKKEKEHTRTYLKHFFSEVEMLMPGVPCHQHFFRYINVSLFIISACISRFVSFNIRLLTI